MVTAAKDVRGFGETLPHGVGRLREPEVKRSFLRLTHSPSSDRLPENYCALSAPGEILGQMVSAPGALGTGDHEHTRLLWGWVLISSIWMIAEWRTVHACPASFIGRDTYGRRKRRNRLAEFE
jgi:hypothetical protein